MDKRSVFECPECMVRRTFRYIEHITMPDGEEGYVRSCKKCGFKRQFTSEGIPFNKKAQKKALKRKTVLDRFLIETLHLNTHEKGLKFEKLCQRLLQTMGYEVEHSGQSGDRGVDLKAVDRDPIKGLTLVVQCKHQESVSADVVIQTLGMVAASNAHKGLVITTGSFTPDATKFAEENSAIEIIDRNKLDDLVKQHLVG